MLRAALIVRLSQRLELGHFGPLGIDTRPVGRQRVGRPRLGNAAQ